MKQALIVTLLVLSCYPTTPASAGMRDGGEPPIFGLWAAVAFSRSKAGSRMDPLGRAFAESSEYTAKTMAIRACRDNDCEIKTYVDTGCIGIATGTDSAYRDWWGFGASQYARRRGETPDEAKAYNRKRAGEAALSSCESATHNRCSINQIYCTWDAEPTDESPRGIDRWIADSGGEFAHNVRNVVQLVNVISQSYLLNVGLNYAKTTCLKAQQWARVTQLANRCRLSVEDLDRLYADANKYSPY